MIKELNEAEFKSKVLESKNLVLLDFNADWCGPCQMLKPVLEVVANEKTDIDFYSVNVDQNDELSRQFNISSIPCLVVFKNGKEIKRNIGMMSKRNILELIEEK
jgi:thioredoxin 1